LGQRRANGDDEKKKRRRSSQSQFGFHARIGFKFFHVHTALARTRQNASKYFALIEKIELAMNADKNNSTRITRIITN
jgi:hypothetical protein